jgi:hypothetical protein
MPLWMQVFWDSAHAKVLLPRVMQLGGVVQAAVTPLTTHVIASMHMSAEDVTEKLSAERAQGRHVLPCASTQVVCPAGIVEQYGVCRSASMAVTSRDWISDSLAAGELQDLCRHAPA